jgi:hypothetical protein
VQHLVAMYSVFCVLNAYVDNPYERICLAMTCRELKALYYNPKYVFVACRSIIHVVHFLRPQQRVDLCYLAYLRKDDYVLLARMMDVCPISIGSCICADLCRNGRLILLQKVLEEALCPEVWCEHLCAAAASTGQIQIMDWLVSTGCSKLTTTALEQAARFGQLRVMEFCLHRQPELWTEEVAMCAARAGNTRVLTWCMKNGFIFDLTKAARTVAPSGDLFTVVSIAKLQFQDVAITPTV